MSDIEKTEHDTLIRTNDAEYVKLVSQISDLWDEARNTAFQAVNTSLLFANWHTGEYIVEYEQRGNIKAEYGKQLLTNLSKDLTLRLGKGYSRSNLFNMRLFYLTYPKIQTVSGQLSWSHYLELLKCDNELEREFYMTQARQEHWRVRELKRQMNSSLFERLALSSDKEGVLALAHHGTQVAKPSDIIHDPFVLEFTGLPVQKRYKESQLEAALKKHMETFLLELGRGFAFIGRQYVIPIGSRRFKVDLVFYHTILKCYVLFDLKRSEIRHQDIGQMNMYMGYFAKEENVEGDNPPIGIVMGHYKDELMVEYATYGMDSNLFVSKYELFLPNKEELRKMVANILEK